MVAASSCPIHLIGETDITLAFEASIASSNLASGASLGSREDKTLGRELSSADSISAQGS